MPEVQDPPPKVVCRRECLDPKQCGVFESDNEMAQPKTVVAYVELREGGEVAYSAIYDSCHDKTIHAEEFMCNDPRLIEKLEKLGGSATQQGHTNSVDELSHVGLDPKSQKKQQQLVVFLTYQPCHKSADKTPDRSCCDTLIKFKEKYLDPAGTELVIKLLFVYKVRKQRSDTSLLDMIQLSDPILIGHTLLIGIMGGGQERPQSIRLGAVPFFSRPQ